MSTVPKSVCVEITDDHAKSLKAFVAYVASLGPGRSVPTPLEPHMTNVASLLGSITQAQFERDDTEKGRRVPK